MKNTIITIASVTTLAGAANAQTYATNVEFFSLGADSSGIYSDPLHALGASDAITTGTPTGMTSIGNRGVLTLSFGTAFSSDGTIGNDITIWEVGVVSEASLIEVSTDGSTFFTVGNHSGGMGGLDFDAAGLAGTYNFVRITDLDNPTTPPYGGADIDAVAVMTPVPEPSSTALLGLGALGFLARHKRS